MVGTGHVLDPNNHKHEEGKTQRVTQSEGEGVGLMRVGKESGKLNF